MRTSRSRVTVLTAVLVAAMLGPAHAQMRGAMGAPLHHAVEIGVHGAYALTGSREVYFGNSYGELDVGSGGSWGITADFTAGAGAQIEFLYNRQDSKLQYRTGFAAKDDVANVAVTYWHVGGLYGIRQGNIMPFASMTFGATQLDFKDSDYSDSWRFSIILGLGAKAFVNERFGLRAQARFPFTYVNSGFGLGCGPGGCYTTIGGNGVFQVDFGGGAFVMF